MGTPGSLCISMQEQTTEQKLSLNYLLGPLKNMDYLQQFVRIKVVRMLESQCICWSIHYVVLEEGV